MIFFFKTSLNFFQELFTRPQNKPAQRYSFSCCTVTILKKSVKTFKSAPPTNNHPNLINAMEILILDRTNTKTIIIK